MFSLWWELSVYFQPLSCINAAVFIVFTMLLNALKIDILVFWWTAESESWGEWASGICSFIKKVS